MVKVTSTFHRDDYFLTMKIIFHDLQNNILNLDAQGLQSRQITSVHVKPHLCQWYMDFLLNLMATHFGENTCNFSFLNLFFKDGWHNTFHTRFLPYPSFTELLYVAFWWISISSRTIQSFLTCTKIRNKVPWYITNNPSHIAHSCT